MVINVFLLYILSSMLLSILPCLYLLFVLIQKVTKNQARPAEPFGRGFIKKAKNLNVCLKWN